MSNHDEQISDSRVFTGIYVDHWEVARFVVETGKRFFGLLPKHDKWQPLFPESFQLPGSQYTTTTRRPAEYFRMTVKGTLGPKGPFSVASTATVFSSFPLSS